VTKKAPIQSANKTERIDVGRIYVGPDGGGFVNPPNDTQWNFRNREELHALIDNWVDLAKQRLSERGAA
jgi:hypothetical protein